MNNIEFGRIKAGYSVSSYEVRKPKNGSLVLVEGKHETILKNDLPFSLIQFHKRQYIQKGYKSENLKVRYKKQFMDWILMILNLYSYFLIGNRKSIGFILGLISCILGVILFYNMMSMIIMYICFGILNVKGFYQWKLSK